MRYDVETVVEGYDGGDVEVCVVVQSPAGRAAGAATCYVDASGAATVAGPGDYSDELVSSLRSLWEADDELPEFDRLLQGIGFWVEDAAEKYVERELAGGWR